MYAMHEEHHFLNENILSEEGENENAVVCGGSIGIGENLHELEQPAQQPNVAAAKLKRKKPVAKIDLSFNFPTIDNHNDIVFPKFNVSQLKQIAAHYKLKVGGNKPDLILRIKNYFNDTKHAIKIQRVFRKYLFRLYISLRGAGFKNRTLCNNSEDFVTLEDLKTIHPLQFISYEASNGFIYGFDINSLYNAYLKQNPCLNPYTREKMPDNLKLRLKRIIKLSKLFHLEISLDYENEVANEPPAATLTREQRIHLRAVNLFQYINELGNYSHHSWFLDLQSAGIVSMMKKLTDIWVYRAELSPVQRRNICPAYANTINMIADVNYLNVNLPLLQNQYNALFILENLIYNGNNEDNRRLAAMYVLGALTLVNPAAANAIPWLYDSFV